MEIDDDMTGMRGGVERVYTRCGGREGAAARGGVWRGSSAAMHAAERARRAAGPQSDQGKVSVVSQGGRAPVRLMTRPAVDSATLFHIIPPSR